MSEISSSSPSRGGHHVPLQGNGAESPHPPQPSPWSILRMGLASRMATAFAASAVLWALVLLAMR
ncbi:hypothetical protein DNX69_19625 [Rhodopseudomonas palustris]|uniref:Uncharacterized protein n=1 Tax=Rhodopseudomonas palustris TaxID=1076 RepID=A0A323UHD8_RHOPL|nr:hypothetical protein [Rhodopseudomonas palustris]PZA11637.1 hypothetical protein DNX69_19625 [Rhodopseudomonas palustris]